MIVAHFQVDNIDFEGMRRSRKDGHMVEIDRTICMCSSLSPMPSCAGCSLLRRARHPPERHGALRRAFCCEGPAIHAPSAR